MRCDCTRARREARAEAFAETAVRLRSLARWCEPTYGYDDRASQIARSEAARCQSLAYAANTPYGFHPSPAPERASSTPPSAAAEDDGFITVWPALDGGVGLA